MADFDLDQYLAQCVGVHEMLDQSDYWVDVRGVVHRVDQMSVRYKANCLTYLRKRAARLGSMYVWGMIGALSLPSGWTDPMRGGHLELNPRTGKMEPVGGRPLTRGELFSDNGGNMDAAFDEYVEETERRVKADPIRWLEDTVLYRAMSDQVIAGEGGTVGERSEDEPREMCPLDPCPKSGCELTVIRHHRSGPLVRLCTGEWVRPT